MKYTGAFEGCASLTEITLPSTLEGVLDSAFANCTNLTTIKFSGTMDKWESINNEDWKENIGNCNIVCSDGTITA